MENCFTTKLKVIMRIVEETRDGKIKYNINRGAIKIAALLPGKIGRD